jgi:pimeloyl-ACP methyl ester carboxylesterase
MSLSPFPIPLPLFSVLPTGKKNTTTRKVLTETQQSLTIRQFLLGNLHRPEGSSPSSVQKFRVPLSILSKSLDYLGDFPFKSPEEVRFNKPALFIRGTRSKYVPDEVIPIIGQFFPCFGLVDVEAGHWLISENPEAFRQGMILFLSFYPRPFSFLSFPFPIT